MNRRNQPIGVLSERPSAGRTTQANATGIR
jgi:hypothetical protein